MSVTQLVNTSPSPQKHNPNHSQIVCGIHMDCLLNYKTVKYFNGEEYKGEHYYDLIRNYQVLEYQVICE